MKTPSIVAGELTEAIMLRIDVKLPELSTREYNSIYEVVLAELIASKEEKV